MNEHNLIFVSHMTRGTCAKCSCGWFSPWLTRQDALDFADTHQAAIAGEWELDDPPGFPRPLPIHRTEAGYPNCPTCDGGGCLDCTDPA